MERSEHIFLIPARFDWDDLGSWKSIYDRQPKDNEKNAVVNASLYAHAANGNLIKTNSNKKVVISGLEDFIVIDSEEVLMIIPMDENQNLKEIAERAQQKFNSKKD
jgi:mannose-1-phosphate guanylyltransferase